MNDHKYHQLRAGSFICDSLPSLIKTVCVSGLCQHQTSNIKITYVLQLLQMHLKVLFISYLVSYLRLDLFQHLTGGLVIVQFTGCGQVLGCLLPVAQQPAAAHTHKIEYHQSTKQMA